MTSFLAVYICPFWSVYVVVSISRSVYYLRRCLTFTYFLSNRLVRGVGTGGGKESVLRKEVGGGRAGVAVESVKGRGRKVSWWWVGSGVIGVDGVGE